MFMANLLPTLLFAVSAYAFPTTSNYSLASIHERTNCTAGTIVCNGPTQFALCNPPQSLVFQPVAAGRLAGGSIAASILSIALGTSAPSAALPPVSTTIIVTSYATVTISSSTSSSAVSQTTDSAVPTSTTASTTTSATSSSSTAAPPATSPSSPASDLHGTAYTGDGGSWPGQESWVGSFDEMFIKNTKAMSASCSQFGQPNNSPQEIEDIKSAIQSVGKSSGVDPRFILAIVMQESNGCSRTWSTSYSVINPGLMQTHEGTGSCYTALAANGVVIKPGVASVPCSSSSITQMITDGVNGTASGPGLAQLLKQAGGNDAQTFYRAARLYNSGAIPSNGDLSAGGATATYASDVANKLCGFVAA
ncbi:hypothetical protein LTR01_001494 [Friedmanniomyces endolithicus]|nr:hypothetical protein LTR01_001494 [Friedmanniomyces endolithicus]KAK0830916.1 hypothetical protein LTR73_003303 [Friedmanniomyces endolithicus]